MLRPLAGLEHGLVGHVGDLLEPGDVRYGRQRAGGDHETAGGDFERDVPLIADHHRPSVAKTRRTLDHADAEAGEALPGIVRRDLFDDAMDAVIDLIELYAGASRL